MARAAGTQVTDKVRLIRELGHGAMGEVWVGRHATLQAEVAVKFVSDELLALHPDAFRRFSIEAAAAARIKSPHVVRTFDHGEMADGTPYIVMELLEGESLHERLDASGPLSIADTFQIIRQVGKALDAAHQAGIIHRDIKPHNIFLTDQQGEMFVKLLDFGSAKLAAAQQEVRLTLPGTLVGTPEYISRDLIKDAKAISHRADLWALGVVAYKCLTGVVPFQGEGIAQVCKAIVAGKVKRPSRLRKELTTAYDLWFASVFDHDPDKRPQTGAAMASAFKLVARAALRTTAPPPPRRAATNRRQRLPLIVLALALGVAILAIITLWLDRREIDPLRAATSAPAASLTPPAASANSSASSSASSSLSAMAAPTATSEPSEEPVPPSSALADYLEPGAGGQRSAGGAGGSNRAPANLIDALAKSRVVIPAGPFWMGCAEETDSECLDNEKPGKLVKLDSYAIDRVEVSVALYSVCVRAGACKAEKLTGYQRADGAYVPSASCNWSYHQRRNHPINCVDYAEAANFCRWVDARLPSEAEWEKAARGLDRRRFPWRGNEANCSLAVMSEGPQGCRANGTWPAGAKRAGQSPYGLLNMAGNVREWVADWYDPKAYRGANGDNPSGPQIGNLRVGRGGSWGNAVGKFMRTTVREGVAPTTRSIHLGFRCAATGND